MGAPSLPKTQDLPPAPRTRGATSLATALPRAYRGYTSFSPRLFAGWRTFHSMQLSLNRRFKNGVAFGLNDTWVLYDHTIGSARLQHDPATGAVSFRADQDQANELLNTFVPNRQILKGHFIWDLPDIHPR